VAACCECSGSIKAVHCFDCVTIKLSRTLLRGFEKEVLAKQFCIISVKGTEVWKSVRSASYLLIKTLDLLYGLVVFVSRCRWN
jgi:hypothetical protein